MSRMISSMIECAYPDGYEIDITQSPLGVGPSPGQIIYIPDTIELIKY